MVFGGCPLRHTHFCQAMHLVSELFLDQVSVLAVPDEYFVHLNGSETKTEAFETSRDGFLGPSAASFWSFGGGRAGHVLSNSRPRSGGSDFGMFWVGFFVFLLNLRCLFLFFCAANVEHATHLFFTSPGSQ